MRIFNVQVRSRTIYLAVFDVVFVITSTNYLIWKRAYELKVAQHDALVGLTIFIICIILSTFIMGLYQRAFLTLRKIAVHTAASFIIAISSILMIFCLSSLHNFPLSVVGAIVLTNFTVIFLVRLILCRIAEIRSFKRRILVFGSESARRLVVELERQVPHAGFVCIGMVGPELFSEGSYWQAGIVESYRNKRPHEIIVSAYSDLNNASWSDLLKWHFNSSKVTSFADFVERETRQLQLDDPDALQAILVHQSPRDSLTLLVKRIFDITVALSLLLLFLPLIVIASLAIQAEDRGPALYRQERTGLGNRPFKIFKFRSMRCDAEADGQPRWASNGDPRITRVGRLLRRSRFDEIPQLINVLRGEMSLVGPRPERPAIVDSLQRTIPLYSYRHLVRPGITGWAQINYPYGQSLEDAREKTRYDLFYVKNGGIFLDLVILLQTIRVILLLEGI